MCTDGGAARAPRRLVRGRRLLRQQGRSKLEKLVLWGAVKQIEENSPEIQGQIGPLLFYACHIRSTAVSPEAWRGLKGVIRRRLVRGRRPHAVPPLFLLL